MRSVMRMRVVFYGALGVNRRAVYVRGEQHTLTDGRTTLARPKERAALVRKRARALGAVGRSLFVHHGTCAEVARESHLLLGAWSLCARHIAQVTLVPRQAIRHGGTCCH